MDVVPVETTSEAQRTALLRRVQESIGKVQAEASRLRRLNSRLIFMSLALSGLATIVAGLTAAMGPLAGEGPPAWRLTCGGVAALTALAGLFSGLHQRFNISDRLAKALTCAGRLRALEIALTVTRRDPMEVAREFEEIHASYQDYFL